MKQLASDSFCRLDLENVRMMSRDCAKQEAWELPAGRHNMLFPILKRVTVVRPLLF